MVTFKPVSISKASFAFCRYSMAVLTWLAFILSSKIILGLVCLIFFLSAVVKVKRAPMIRLYDVLFNKNKNNPEIMVDENSIFFAHLLGLVMSVTCLFLVCTIDKPAIWYTVLGFALLKSISALGFCPASKLYDCTLNGNCCVRKHKNGTYPSC